MDYEEDDVMRFDGIEQSAVMQDTRAFSDRTIDGQKCCEIITRVLYLIATGHSITESEATDVFFASTKLFHCNHDKVRRMLFILLKELAPSVEQAFIASASLVADINSNKKEMYRCNAIRALRKVTDSSTIGQLERYIRQALVDKDNSVVSASLVTAIHLTRVQPDMVKRWVTDVSEAAKGRGNRAQYHALALLHQLRKSDRLSVQKLVRSAREAPIRSPLALCLIIKLCTELMQEDFAASTELYNFVNNMTHHTSDMVVFEAAKSLASIRGLSSKEITSVVLVLQLFLNSHRPVLRFASVRLLNRIATHHPSAVACCHGELETMVHDMNRSIGMLAVTTLLKSCTEHSLDRFLSVASSFMAELGEDSKVVIIEATKLLVAKYPDKYPALITFLHEVLSEPTSSADLKLMIVETLVSIVKSNPNATELALRRLAEFIEDSEYNAITSRVLTVLGQHGPATTTPSTFIRYINNRIVLDKPAIRAVGVATLAKFGAASITLRPRVIKLLKRATIDADDDVRDRAILYYGILTSGDEYIIRSLVTVVAEEVAGKRKGMESAPARLRAAADTTDDTEAAVAAKEQANAVAAGGDAAAASTAAPTITPELLALRDRMRQIPQLRDLGEPLRSVPPQMLTDADCEYVVSVVKHVYGDKLVLQYKVTNTLEATLRNVSINPDFSELESATPLFAIPSETIAPGEMQCVYIVLSRDSNDFPAGTITQTCTFAMQEDDDLLDAEDYPLEDFALNVCDYITPFPLPDFDGAWGGLEGEDATETYALDSMKNLTEAQNEVVDFYGMDVVGGKPGAVTARSHTVKMSGTIACSGRQEPVLVEAKVFISANQKVALTLSLRSKNQSLRQFLVEAIVS